MPLRYRRRPARRMRRRPVRRYARRSVRASLHAPKKFTMLYKFTDVVPDTNGTNADGYQKTPLAVDFATVPGSAQLAGMYRQFAITGVQYQYRTTNIYGSNVDDQPSLTMLFAEDKANIAAPTAKNLQSQDNCKVLRSTRNFRHYVKNPRPVLYQTDGANNIFTIQSARQIQWFDCNSVPCLNLPHLAAQFQIEDCPAGVVAPAKQGEIWAKVYVVMKEQAVG